MKNAIEGFLRTLDHETFPVHGLDRYTVIYLVAVYYYGLGDYKNALVWLGKVILGQNVNARLKDKGLDLKERIKVKLDELNIQE